MLWQLCFFEKGGGWFFVPVIFLAVYVQTKPLLPTGWEVYPVFGNHGNLHLLIVANRRKVGNYQKVGNHEMP
jgi:hypothetical protein